MIREVAERAYFFACLVCGGLLRAVRYSNVRIVDQHGETQVRKRRSFVAPLLITIADPVMRLLDTGVRVLHHKAWHAREREIYSRLYGMPIRGDDDGTLVLPHLHGETLAAVLDDPARKASVKNTAIERAAAALAKFHRLGFTHADAMAENVLIDPGTARWFDFETIHEASRPTAWRQADDLRALLMTCLVRTSPDKVAEALNCILDGYADENVTRMLAASLESVWRRALMFHLAQAPVSYRCSREVGRLLNERLDRK